MRLAIRVALKDRRLRSGGHVTPEGVCRVVLELAVDHFAEAGKDELIRWEIGSSEMLGRFIHELASDGGIELSEADAKDAFVGWYDVTRDASTWKLKW
ncbi:MAG: hypothetical protein AAF802_23850 [Planctomycetota bacterium]